MVRTFDPVLGLNVAGEGWQGGTLDAATLRARMSKALDTLMERPNWRHGLATKEQVFIDDIVRRQLADGDDSFTPTLAQVRYAESVAIGALGWPDRGGRRR